MLTIDRKWSGRGQSSGLPFSRGAVCLVPTLVLVSGRFARLNVTTGIATTVSGDITRREEHTLFSQVQNVPLWEMFLLSMTGIIADTDSSGVITPCTGHATLMLAMSLGCRQHSQS